MRELTAEELWVEAISQTSKNWFDGPYRYISTRGLWANGELMMANPASRFSARRLEKLRAVDDLRRSATYATTLAKMRDDLTRTWEHLCRELPSIDSCGAI